MTNRMDKRDKRLPPALIKPLELAVPLGAAPRGEPGGIDALHQQQFENLLQEARRPAEPMPEQWPLAPSPLIPARPASPAEDTAQAPPEPTAEPALAAQHPLERADEHAPDIPKPRQDVQDHDTADLPAGPGLQTTPLSLDPRVLSARRKRKLQIDAKVHEDAARAIAQEQATVRAAPQMPQPSGQVAIGNSLRTKAVEGIASVRQVSSGARMPPAPPPLDLPPADALVRFDAADGATPDACDLSDLQATQAQQTAALELAEDPQASGPSPDPLPVREAQRAQASARQETLVGEMAAAQVAQATVLAQVNTPESLPLHLLESI